MLRQLTASDAASLCNQEAKVLPDATPDASRYCNFLAKKPAAAIHFDASWDATCRAITRSVIADAEQVLAERVNFGEVDFDSDPDLAKSIPILNGPSVAYFGTARWLAL